MINKQTRFSLRKGVNGLIPIVKMGNGAPDFSCFQSSLYVDTATKELYVNV